MEILRQKPLVQLVNELYSCAYEKAFSGVKDKMMSPFKINTNKNYSKPTCLYNVYGG